MQALGGHERKVKDMAICQMRDAEGTYHPHEAETVTREFNPWWGVSEDRCPEHPVSADIHGKR